MASSSFKIPVVLFIFKRQDTVIRILDRIKQVKPEKLYIISDGGRDKEEHEEVKKCRKAIEEHINWPCVIVRNYAEENKGVYDRIGLGAKWVLSKEESAIFLEDDNLPEVTFFKYCEEMLDKYREDTRVLWVCGTNYLQKYNTDDDYSYVFTKHLMPCGWASWSHKFNKYYDGEMELFTDQSVLSSLSDKYGNKKLYNQQLYNFYGTKDKLENNRKRASWDYQMAFTIRVNNLYGISPKYNQIENIGVDEHSTHGGNSYRKVMTRRFCSIKSYPLKFPLKHPKVVSEDKVYEEKVGNYILIPFMHRLAIKIIRVIKPIFKVGKYESFPRTMKNRFEKLKIR